MLVILSGDRVLIPACPVVRSCKAKFVRTYQFPKFVARALSVVAEDEKDVASEHRNCTIAPYPFYNAATGRPSLPQPMHDNCSDNVVSQKVEHSASELVDHEDSARPSSDRWWRNRTVFPFYNASLGQLPKGFMDEACDVSLKFKHTVLTEPSISIDSESVKTSNTRYWTNMSVFPFYNSELGPPTPSAIEDLPTENLESNPSSPQSESSLGTADNTVTAVADSQIQIINDHDIISDNKISKSYSISMVEASPEDEKAGFVVFYDIETTGLPAKGGLALGELPKFYELRHYENCRIVQMSYVICRKSNLDIVYADNIIVKSDGFPILNSEFHGVTEARSREEGVPLRFAAEKFFRALSNATHIIAHNANFDITVTKSEFLRYSLKRYLERLDDIAVICSMQKTKHVVQAKDKLNRLKNPRLEELFQHVMKRPMENAHDAMHDVLNLHEAVSTLFAKKVVNPDDFFSPPN